MSLTYYWFVVYFTIPLHALIKALIVGCNWILAWLVQGPTIVSTPPRNKVDAEGLVRLTGWFLTQLTRIWFLESGDKKIISCDSTSPGVDGLSLTGYKRELVKVHVTWPVHHFTVGPKEKSWCNFEIKEVCITLLNSLQFPSFVSLSVKICDCWGL